MSDVENYSLRCEHCGGYLTHDGDVFSVKLPDISCGYFSYTFVPTCSLSCADEAKRIHMNILRSWVEDIANCSIQKITISDYFKEKCE